MHPETFLPDVETRKERGKQSKGIHNVPKRPPSKGGRKRFQARSDYTVQAEHDTYLGKVERGWDPHNDGLDDGLDDDLDLPDPNMTELSKPVELHHKDIDPFSVGAQRVLSPFDDCYS
jgi:hypothetical protein